MIQLTELINARNIYIDNLKLLIEINNKICRQVPYYNYATKIWEARADRYLDIKYAEGSMYEIVKQSINIRFMNYSNSIPIHLISNPVKVEEIYLKNLKVIQAELDSKNKSQLIKLYRYSELMATMMDYKIAIKNYLIANSYEIEDLYIDSNIVYIVYENRHIPIYTVSTHSVIKLKQVKELIKYNPIKRLVRAFMLQEAKLLKYIF